MSSQTDSHQIFLISRGLKLSQEKLKSMIEVSKIVGKQQEMRSGEWSLSEQNLGALII